MRKMEQADITDNVITGTINPNETTDNKQLITKTDVVTPIEELIIEAHKKAEAAIEPKTSMLEH